jgi:uncharacterized protein (DUF433 family)
MKSDISFSVKEIRERFPMISAPYMRMTLEQIADKLDDTWTVRRTSDGAVTQIEKGNIWVKVGVGHSVPCIKGTGISVLVIQYRHAAGETLEAIANDYELPVNVIQEAVDYGAA